MPTLIPIFFQCLNVNHGLTNRLCCKRIITEEQQRQVDEIQSGVLKKKKLLAIILKERNIDTQTFVECLINAKQPHLAKIILGEKEAVEAFKYHQQYQEAILKNRTTLLKNLTPIIDSFLNTLISKRLMGYYEEKDAICESINQYKRASKLLDIICSGKYRFLSKEMLSMLQDNCEIDLSALKDVSPEVSSKLEVESQSLETIHAALDNKETREIIVEALDLKNDFGLSLYLIKKPSDLETYGFLLDDKMSEDDRNNRFLDVLKNSEALSSFLHALMKDGQGYFVQLMQGKKDPGAEKFREMLESNRKNIVSKMETGYGLLDALLAGGAINFFEFQLLSEENTFERSNRLIDLLKKRPGFEKAFRESLKETNQKHVIDLLNAQEHTASETFKETLCQNYPILTDKMNPDDELLKALFDANVITFNQYQSLKATALGRCYKTSELLEMLLKRPDSDKAPFYESLEKANQPYLLNLLQGKEDRDAEAIHENCNKNLVSLVAQIDIKIQGFLDELVEKGVINLKQKETLTANENGNDSTNSNFIDILCRLSSNQLKELYFCLEARGQKDVIKLMFPPRFIASIANLNLSSIAKLSAMDLLPLCEDALFSICRHLVPDTMTYKDKDMEACYRQKRDKAEEILNNRSRSFFRSVAQKDEESVESTPIPQHQKLLPGFGRF